MKAKPHSLSKSRVDESKLGGLAYSLFLIQVVHTLGRGGLANRLCLYIQTKQQAKLLNLTLPSKHASTTPSSSD